MPFSDQANARFYAMLHARTRQLGAGDPVAEPLIATSMYHLPDQPEDARIYGRTGNPTVQAAEARLAVLEDAPTLLFPSGMAAYGALAMAALKAGDEVLLLSDGYYAARSMMSEIMANFGVTMRTVAAADIAHAKLNGLAMVIIETPSNPTLDVVDIAALSKACKVSGCLLAVDNTVCTALLQNPLELGADISLASDTKAASGHSDVLMGHVSSRDDALMEKLLSVRSLMGAIPGPFEAWLLMRGLETLEVRMSRMCENAEAALPLLQASAAISRVYYPAPHPQAAHTGFLIGADFADKTAADAFIKASGFVPATSFGGLHSSADRRARWGDDVSEGFLRLSMGVEPTNELVAAIKRGLEALQTNVS